MKKIFKPTLIALTATLITGCCWSDHSKTIKEIAEPMLKELEAFYKTNKRFPNTKERDVMLEKAGCEMKGDVCFFEGEELTITKSGKNLSGDYYMSIEVIDKETNYDVASCGFSIYTYDEKDFVMCSKRPCVTIRQ